MSAVPKPFITPEEYLRRERLASFKSEYYKGEVFAMAGASPAHVRINSNLVVALGQVFGDGPCYTLSNDMRVKVSDTGLYAYPDTIVLCEEPQTQDDDVLLNPKIIFEILSSSTESYDRGLKFELYRTIPTLTEYILIAQDRAHCDQFIRSSSPDWLVRSVSGPGAVLELATLSARLPLARIYRGITFPPNPPLPPTLFAGDSERT